MKGLLNMSTGITKTSRVTGSTIKNPFKAASSTFKYPFTCKNQDQVIANSLWIILSNTLWFLNAYICK